MKTMEAENDSALSKNESAIDRLRTDMEKTVSTITMRVVGIVSLGVTTLGGFIAILQFLT